MKKDRRTTVVKVTTDRERERESESERFTTRLTINAPNSNLMRTVNADST